MARPVLIAYDGSADARAALACAGRLMPGRPAVVLSVWEPLIVQFRHTLLPGAFPVGYDTEQQDEIAEEATRRLAEQGARPACAAGLEATARPQRETDTIWSTIVQVAREIDAEVIVTGTAGLGGLRALVLGSVAKQVLQHAKRPVLVVPGPRGDG